MVGCSCTVCFGIHSWFESGMSVAPTSGLMWGYQTIVENCSYIELVLHAPY